VTTGNTLAATTMTFPQRVNTPLETLKKIALSLIQVYSSTEILCVVTVEGALQFAPGQPIAISSDRIAPQFRYPYSSFYPVQIDYDYAQGGGFTMTITATNRPWGLQSKDSAQNLIFA
jgi:hypothetical protein